MAFNFTNFALKLFLDFPLYCESRFIIFSSVAGGPPVHFTILEHPHALWGAKAPPEHRDCGQWTEDSVQ